MALIEVKRERVRQDHRYLIKRYLQDASRRLTIYIWQLPEDDDGEMLRFQISFREIALDWAAERGMRYATVDDGDNPMGMKRSPILSPEHSLERRMVERLLEILAEFSGQPSVEFIRQVLLKDAERGAPA